MKWARNWILLPLCAAAIASTGCGDEGTQGPRPDAGMQTDAGGPVMFEGAKAHWVAPDRILLPADAVGTSTALYHAPDGGMMLQDGALVGGEPVALIAVTDDLPVAITDKFPHLADFQVFRLDLDDPSMGLAMLGDQLAVASQDDEGNLVAVTGVQTAGVLDSEYSYEGPLGVTFEQADEQPSFRLWAPTARSVDLHIYDADKTELMTVPMVAPAAADQGVWTYEAADTAWYGLYYKYEVTVFAPAAAPSDGSTVPGAVVANLVTDPYSVGLATNSAYSLIVDLADPDTKPVGWDTLQKPALGEPEDIVLYEAHVRDFSAHDATVAAEHQGKYLAFTYDGEADDDNRALSDGMAHLKALAEAGLTHVHLLPVFDIATVDEDPANRVELDDTVGALCASNAEVPAETCSAQESKAIRTLLAEVLALAGGATDTIQAMVGYMRGLDAFNWGYDPYHYTTPEGSYATDADGITRIRELRAMVQGLSQIGLRTVMDVVYNHTNASGQAEKSVLDRIVPGYYHRRNAFTGEVERSTCCENTATEHSMMEKLMLDSVMVWARDYKVDGFRFDLMGHHMKANMERVTQAVRSLTPAADGVDGATIYVYGEGWDFGEVQDDTRGVNATQQNMAGTGIGTFSDRLRDAVRGGGPFDGGDSLRENQGFANGLFYDPNEKNEGSEKEKNLLLAQTDLIRVGLAGNLEDFVVTEWSGSDVSGAAVSYNGYPAGYTLDPQEIITYVTAHDNQTLWDNNQYKIPTGTSMDTRVRIQNLGLSTTLLAQGVPFLHMGAEMLRSKSMERDSYDSGDWYNKVDFTYETNNWNVGLPRADKDGDNYPVIEGIIDDASIAPQKAHIEATVSHVLEMLRIRKSSRLFRLTTGADVTARVDFHNTGADQIPGLIVMSITDGTCAGTDLDPALDGVVVLFNANDEDQTFSLAGTGLAGTTGYVLHDVQASSADTTVQAAGFDAAGFFVPARTTAVFELPQTDPDVQGQGLTCNAKEATRTEPGGTLLDAVYLRGSMNEWSATSENILEQQSATTYAITLTLAAGSYQFKIASEDWSTYAWGSKDGTPLAPGDTGTLAPGAGDIGLDIATDGSYRFTLDTSSFSEAQLTIEAAAN